MKAERIASGGMERIRDASMPRLILSPRSIEEFKAKIALGDILSGRVLETLDGEKSLIRFLDFNVVAQSDLPLEKGALVRAEVTGVQDQVFMRILSPGGSLDNVTALFEQLGISPTRANLEIAALMVRAGIPLTVENLREVFNALAALPHDRPTAEVLVLARALEAPTTEASVAALRILTEPPVPLGERIATLTTQLNQALEALSPGDFASARELSALLNTLTIRPEEGNIAEQLTRFLNALGLDAERQAATGAALAPSLKRALWGVRAELNLRIVEALQRGETAALFQALRENVTGFLSQLDAYQMLARIPALNLPNLYLQCPYWSGVPVPMTLEVRARKQNPGEETDPLNTDIEFSVKTKRWGVVRIRMTIREGHLTGRVEAETPEAKALIESRIARLVGHLRDAGFTVQRIACHVANALEEPVVHRMKLTERRYLLDVEA